MEATTTQPQPPDLDLPGPRTLRLLAWVDAHEAAARTGIGGDGGEFVAGRRGRGALREGRVDLGSLRRKGPVPEWHVPEQSGEVPVVGRDV